MVAVFFCKVFSHLFGRSSRPVRPSLVSNLSPCVEARKIARGLLRHHNSKTEFYLYSVFLHTYTRHAVEYRHFHVENPLVSALASHSRETACKALEGHRTIWSISPSGYPSCSLLVGTNLNLYIYMYVCSSRLHPFETEGFLGTRREDHLETCTSGHTTRKVARYLVLSQRCVFWCPTDVTLSKLPSSWTSRNGQGSARS